MEFISGLVSISFRKLSYKEIIDITAESGLSAIEWGGDVHVPLGELDIADKVRLATAERGLTVPEYGSYYVISKSGAEKAQAAISSARALGTRVIRVWASDKNRSAMSDEEYLAAVEDAKMLCDSAPDLTFCLECHNHSITEDYRDAAAYIADVGRANFKTFWQPNQFRDHSYNTEALEALLPSVVSVHVFSWEGNAHYPLDHHAERWADYLAILKRSDADKIHLMLEFMHDNSQASLKNTADVLNRWIAQINQ